MFKMFGKLIKGIAAVVIALVVLGMVFGGGSSSESKKSDTAKEQAATEAAADTEEKKDDKKKDEAEEAAEEEPEEEAAPEEEEEVDEGPSIATNSKYAVTINGWRIVEDYDGAPCIAIDYTFTNVSDDSATSMQLATNITVYQNGVECEDAYFASDNSDGYSNKVKAGVSVDVTRVYKLQDTTSDVEVEVGQLFSWNDDLLAYEVFQIA